MVGREAISDMWGSVESVSGNSPIWVTCLELERQVGKGVNMGVSDPIADMLTRIRNAILVKKESVVVTASVLKTEVAKILVDEGFLASYEVLNDGTKDACIKLGLYYKDKGDSAIAGLKRVSKPGLRIYKHTRGLPKVLGGLGVAIISTSKGVMSDRDARKQGVGGEVLCYVY